MSKIGALLALMIAFSLSFSADAQARSARAGADAVTAVSNAGNGMNREGSAGVHPGRGWKDPGQVQGSEKNHADPDCTGNRTRRPQGTNKGACDDPNGAADKPGGAGGFNTDRDYNNGCGNDSDFEDDNNGRCGGMRSEASKPPVTVTPVVPTSVLGTLTRRPVQVLGERIRAASPLTLPSTLPSTGIDIPTLILGASGLVCGGRMLAGRASTKRRSRRAGFARLFCFYADRSGVMSVSA